MDPRRKGFGWVRHLLWRLWRRRTYPLLALHALLPRQMCRRLVDPVWNSLSSEITVFRSFTCPTCMVPVESGLQASLSSAWLFKTLFSSSKFKRTPEEKIKIQAWFQTILLPNCCTMVINSNQSENQMTLVSVLWRVCCVYNCPGGSSDPGHWVVGVSPDNFQIQ